MTRYVALLGGTMLIGLGSLGLSAASSPRLDQGQVMVHCRTGGTDAFVTPKKIRISVGDTVVWRTAGNVVADSLMISLKHPEQQTWPFEGPPPVGGTVVQTGPATQKDSVQYNVTVVCRKAGGGTQHELIDPDIIID